MWTLLTILLAVLSPRPNVDNSVTALLRADSSAVAQYLRFQQRFGSDEVIVVRLEGGDDFARYRVAATVTATLAEHPSMQGVISVAALHPEVTEVILDEVFGGPATLRERQQELQTPTVEALRLWTTQTASAGANLYGLATVSAPAARAQLAAQLEAHRTQAAKTGVLMRFTGPPLLNLALDRAGRRTETLALPLLLGVSIVLLLLFTGSPSGTAALIAPVGLTVLAVDGLFGACGGTTNLLVNIVKPLLFVIGLASAVHVFVECRQLAVRGIDRRQAPWVAARRKSIPVSLALLTTAVGFGSLALSSVAPIRTFGWLAGVGLVVMIPGVLLTVPQGLALVARLTGAPGPWSRRAEEWVGHAAERLVVVGLRRPRAVIVLGILTIFAGAVAFPLLDSEPHAIRYFPADHPLRKDQAHLEQAGLGIATLEAVYSGDELTSNPAVIPALLRVAEVGAKDPAVAMVIGWPHLAEEVRVRGARPGVDAWTLQRLNEKPAGRAFGRDDSVRVAFLVGTVDVQALDRLKLRLRTASANDAELSDLQLELTGNYDLLLQAQAALLNTLLVSLAWTAVLMELALLVVLRSWRLGLVALVPNLFPVAVNLLVMAILGIPLDLGTSMTAAIAMGIAVDDTLHFVLAAYRTPVQKAARSAGAAIILSSLVIGSGFAALLIADFLPTRRFGGLCALAMFGALVADLLILPPLLEWARGNQERRE